MKNLLKTSVAAAALFAGGELNAWAEETNLYWGDTHLHTSYSPDAYFFGNATADIDTAYNYAKGLPVIHPYHRARIKIETPLDFLVVSDHAEYMGVPRLIGLGDPRIAETETGKRFIQMVADGNRMGVIEELIATANSNQPNEELNSPELKAGNWADIIAAADRHNDPGKFTAFIGWEWSSIYDGANLHRVVFMEEDAKTAGKFLPFSSFDSIQPEGLWAWLDQTEKKTGANFVAIPHNSNVSKGFMFDEVDSNGQPISADYANFRMRWEPVVEITQIKGDSETHPNLSPNDEFADFEFYPHLLDTRPGADRTPSTTPGDYVRGGLMRGLELEEKVGANPYKFGVVGSTDAHTAMASAEEDNFWGKTALDSIPENKEAEAISGSSGWDMSASGLAAVWAEENTRESILAAFKRKEVYATTGPLIQLRFFGGWDYDASDADARDLADIGYAKGVPMGGDLTNPPESDDGAVVGFFKEVVGQDKPPAPSFLIHAAKDPKDANLDRIQVVKGWVGADGVAREKVYDVAWSGERAINADGKLPPVGSTVDLETGMYTNSIGNAQLAVVWSDPDFDASQRSFYYVRVLQIPTPRHSTFDAIALGINPADTGHAVTIQERAYSSPIWYTP